jgi:uncharacterized metal-binding protein YceD (DUF177 family)
MTKRPEPFLVEFSRPVSVVRLGADAVTYRIDATGDERAALARRFDLVSIDHFAAEVTLSRHGSDIGLAAEIAADIVQLCCLTLEPFASKLIDRATLLYRRKAPPAADLVVEDEDYEVLVGDEIDVGEAAAQQLSLALDPFPRAPGATIDESVISGPGNAVAGQLTTGPQAPKRPFAELAKLVKK